MSLLIIYPDFDLTDWLATFQKLAPDLEVVVWPEVPKADAIEFAVCWNQPPEVLKQFPNLKCISSFGAGVNHLLNDPTLPADIPLVRVVDQSLKQSMAEYILFGILRHFRRFSAYQQQQQEAEWRPLSIPPLSELTVGIMGYGALGAFVGEKLRDFGCNIQGWSRTPKNVDGIRIYTGQEELAAFLGQSDILVCLLPLTGETENILNRHTFNQLPTGAYLINAARGAHLVEKDLLSALDSGQISGALLDVFREEPLPKTHRFWSHDKITITPHIASLTNPHTAAVQILENYQRALNQQPLLNRVCRERGY